MHHDLITLGAGGFNRAVRQKALGDQGQGIRAARAERNRLLRRSSWNVLAVNSWTARSSAFMIRAPASAGSRQFSTSEPSSSCRKLTPVLLLSRLTRQLLGLLATAICTDQFLDVLRGAVLGDHQQVVLGRGLATRVISRTLE